MDQDHEELCRQSKSQLMCFFFNEVMGEHWSNYLNLYLKSSIIAIYKMILQKYILCAKLEIGKQFENSL